MPKNQNFRSPLHLTLGVAAGAALALAAPMAASAHVHVTPDESEAGATTPLTFSFSHGCDDSPTTALIFDVPDAVAAVNPVLQGGWSITTETGADGVPTQITYTADEPIATGIRASVQLDVLFAEAAQHSQVAFPVTQTCVAGEHTWVDVAADGEAEPDSPAPLVSVGDVAEASGHDHGDHEADPASTESPSNAGTSDHHGADADAGSSGAAGSDVLARALGGLGLLIGVVALALTLVRGKRRS